MFTTIKSWFCSLFEEKKVPVSPLVNIGVHPYASRSHVGYKIDIRQFSNEVYGDIRGSFLRGYCEINFEHEDWYGCHESDVENLILELIARGFNVSKDYVEGKLDSFFVDWYGIDFNNCDDFLCEYMTGKKRVKKN